MRDLLRACERPTAISWGLDTHRETTASTEYQTLTGKYMKWVKRSSLTRRRSLALCHGTAAIVAAFIYGSIASGQERPNSDIDLMVIGTVKFEDVIRLIHPYQEELRREINPHVYTAAEFKRKAREDSSFAARILKLPRISVIGDPDELGKFGKDRKAKAT